MKELAFYFFQCVNDRIQAKANTIEMYIVENNQEDKLELMIRDNGEKFDIGLMKADNSVAMKKYPALNFLQKDSKENKGDFKILSHNQTGNLIEISYPLKNKQRTRLGSISNFLSILFVAYPQIHFIYSQISKKGEFLFDSEQFTKALNEMDFEEQEFLSNLKELLDSQSASIQVFA
ncbi:MAG: hypothetical protein J7J72_07670 [Bacteroidales bacterium]|nr:hypothetical protein [Bacteroidales bacterium]